MLERWTTQTSDRSVLLIETAMGLVANEDCPPSPVTHSQMAISGRTPIGKVGLSGPAKEGASAERIYGLIGGRKPKVIPRTAQRACRSQSARRAIGLLQLNTQSVRSDSAVCGPSCRVGAPRCK